MLKVTMQLNDGTEIIILKRDERPVRISPLSNYLSGLINIPEEFEELLFKFLIDRQNRATMKMLLQEEQKCRKNIEKLAYIQRLKDEIVRNWSE